MTSQITLQEALFAGMAKKLTPAEAGRLNEEDTRGLVARVYNEMELRVGTRLSAALSDAEMGEFADIIDDPANGEAVSVVWLEAHCPNYREVVDEVMADVVAETVDVIAAQLRIEAMAAEATDPAGEN